ncbi:MAG: hypothetical protein FJ295_01925 [Planctomycetes bacterium]|nr:hypothetical protein [Planctomycetota bacterium]
MSSCVMRQHRSECSFWVCPASPPGRLRAIGAARRSILVLPRSLSTRETGASRNAHPPLVPILGVDRDNRERFFTGAPSRIGLQDIMPEIVSNRRVDRPMRSGWPRRDSIALAGVLLLALGLRLWQIREPLWVDELHTSWCVMESFHDVAPRARMGNQSPLYFYLAWCSVHALGPSEFSLRLPSLLAGLALIACSYQVVRKAVSRPSIGPLLTALLLAVDSTAIFYAQEARPYALVQCLGVLQIDAWCRAFGYAGNRSRSHAWRWISFSLLLFFLHYTCMLVIAVQIVIGAVAVWSQGGGGWRARWTESLLLAVPLAGPLAVGNQLRSIASHADDWRMIVPQDGLAALLAVLPQWPEVLGSLVCLLLATRLSFGRRADGEPNPRWRPFFAWSTILAGALIAAVVIDQLRLAPILHLRYLILVATIPALLIGYAETLLPTRRWRIAYLLVIALLTAGGSPFAPQLLRDGRLLADRSEDWSSLVRELDSLGGRHPMRVLLFGNLIEDGRLRDSRPADLVEYLRFPLRGLYRPTSSEWAVIPFPTRTGTNFDALHLLPAPARAPSSQDRYVTVIRSGDLRLVQGIEDQLLDSQPLRFVRRTAFGRLWLTEFAPRESADASE